jgi:hypothetical protein
MNALALLSTGGPFLIGIDAIDFGMRPANF